MYISIIDLKKEKLLEIIKEIDNIRDIDLITGYAINIKNKKQN